MVGFRHQAVTQIKQLGAGSVPGWVTASLRPAYRNAKREVIVSGTVDWGQTLWNCRLFRHRFSAVFLCPHANAIHHRKEWLRSRSQGGTCDRKKVKERRNGKKRGKGKRGWRYVKGNSRTDGTTNKKNEKKIVFGGFWCRWWLRVSTRNLEIRNSVLTDPKTSAND